ncbi:cupin domain-containing protein [Streptomyces niveus]|uniref:cupin domain-containing protein n=1 Tax=Streptomyces niveus TaxID=193462 RepID=UPI003CFE81D0
MLKDASEQGAAAAGPVVAVDAGSIPASDRFGWWSDMVGHEVMPVSIRSAHSGRFQGRVEVVDLPYGQVSTFSNSPMTAHRSSLQIRRQDPEEYFLILVRGSSIRLEQARGVVCLGVGDMGLFSTSHPLACEFHDRDQPVRVTLLRLPRAVLPLRGGGVDRLLAESLPAGTGSAALLGPYLAGLPDAARACAPAELARLGAIGVDLATSFRLDPASPPGALPRRPGEPCASSPHDRRDRHPVGIPSPRGLQPGVPRRLRSQPERGPGACAGCEGCLRVRLKPGRAGTGESGTALRRLASVSSRAQSRCWEADGA